MMSLRKDPQESMRLDKWLWCARFFKTRALANVAIRTGKIHSEGERCKPSHLVRIGTILKIRQGPVNMEIRVFALSAQRLNAAAAAGLYEETETGKAERELVMLQLEANTSLVHAHGRPTKKDRRALMQFIREVDA